MNKVNFLLCRKLFGCSNHHQLPNEHVLKFYFAFLLNANCKVQSVKMQQTEKSKNAFPGMAFVLCHYLLYVISFLYKTGLLKPFLC